MLQLRLFALLILTLQGTCQVLNAIREEPILFSSSSIPSLGCCNVLRKKENNRYSSSGKSRELMSCVNESLAMCTSEMKSLAIVGYYTESILEYAAYSSAVNTIYAQHHGYHIRHLTASDGAEYFPQDQRWNKVKILLDALHPQHGWAKDFDYLVWLDSDLIILDLGLDIIAIAEKYPQSDIILCADKDISVGIANTGFMVVRNTDFMLDFLSSWWNDYDKATAMDQYAFTKLYQREKKLRPLSPSELAQYDRDVNMSPYSTKRIAILRADALNSNFPSWLRQVDHNQVLHLAGANKEMRQKAFHLGLTNICDHVHGEHEEVG